MGRHHRLRGYRTVKNVINKQAREYERRGDKQTVDGGVLLIIILTFPIWVLLLLKYFYVFIPLGFVLLIMDDKGVL